MKDKRPVMLQSSSEEEKIVRLGRDIQVKIGQHLRTLYDEVVNEGVPQRLNDLLQQLDDAEKNKPKE